MPNISSQRNKLIILLFIICTFYFSSAGLAFESDLTGELEKQETAFMGEAGLTPDQSIGDIIASAIQGFLALLGIIFIILILYAGYTWMTADGDEQKITKAKDTIKRAIIGLIITIGAFAITYFIFSALPGGTGGVGTPGGG